MILNETIVEDAALTLPAATLTRSLPRGEEEPGHAVAAKAGLADDWRERIQKTRRLNFPKG